MPRGPGKAASEAIIRLGRPWRKLFLGHKLDRRVDDNILRVMSSAVIAFQSLEAKPTMQETDRPRPRPSLSRIRAMTKPTDVWYVRLPGGKVVRARTTKALRHHIRSGRVSVQARVRRTPSEDWTALEWAPEFADLVSRD